MPNRFSQNIAFMKQRLILTARRRTLLAVIPLSLGLAGQSGYANPSGMTVVSGAAHSSQHGNTLQITTSRNAVLQWNSFNIGSGETTIFNEPSPTSIVFNNINNANPTTIFGSLEANGIVVLENQAGFYFGPHAFVKAGGLVVTTAAISPWSSGGGAGWSFDGPPTAAPIVNYGCLETAYGGSLFLIGKDIQNQGTIATPGGSATLVAGQQVLLSERPNGLSLSAPVQLPAGSVDNQGRIVADAGQVLLQAQNVNNSGLIQANSVRNNNGVIELYASQNVQLTGSSVIQANGSGDGITTGGKIVIKSGNIFSDTPSSQITATGGPSGGNGGNVEISAPNILSLNSSIDASAQNGWSEGVFSMDPENIVLGSFSSGSTPATGGVIDATGSSGIVDVDVGSAFKNIDASILLEASGTITLNTGTIWNLSASTGKTAGQLTLEAGGSITLDSGSMIEDPNDWSMTLEAGYNFAAGGGVISGAGTAANDVILLGNAAITTAAGNINVVAGNNVTVGTGGIVTGIANNAVMTGTGGNVNVQAVAGDVSCSSSSSTGGYQFTTTGVGYTVSPNLGGISTASGGNVTIQAGGSITAPLPGSTTVSDYGIGAFGAAPGDVTLTAGGNVTGHYVLANGTGTITAGSDAGTVIANLALSLIDGGWVVNAADNIYLQEVRNPNGIFNSSPKSDSVSYLFNYGPLDSVALDAGIGVYITGGTTSPLPRANKSEGLIFPPILTIDAGAGGITFDTSVNLFPSPEGTLDLTTTDGGNLEGAAGAGATINISDSTRVAYSSSLAFQNSDPDENPLLHLDDPNPVLINISGLAQNISLDSPKPVEMYVTGNIIDCSASIENLRASDTSTISAGGEIIDKDNFVETQLQPGQTPNLTALEQVSEPTIIGPDGTPIANPNLNGTLEPLQTSFSYDATTHSLVFFGAMTVAQENALLAIHFLDSTDLNYIQQQSQNETLESALNYTVLGPGTFRINAASISLGNGGGIISAGFGNFSQLAPVTPRGADIDISVTGNLSMLASSIESEYGGNINITSGGSIDVGSPALGPLVNQEEDQGQVFGIVSVWSGNISVIADGDIDVDSSRIATYDGGNILVESLQGNVNAGSGGNGQVGVAKTFLNAQGQVDVVDDFIPGSGILATSFPQLVYGQTSSQIGNITVETPEGSIVASHGGIVQIPLGPVTHNDATINLIAGSENSDGKGVAYVGNVDASGSGVIGGQVNISATGSINGLVVASLGANVNALQNISATVLSQGSASVVAGGTVSGTVVGVGSVSVSGASDVAAAFGGGGVSASGAQSGAAVAAAPTGSNSSSAAATQQQVAQATQSNSEIADNGNESDEEKKKRAQKSKLMEYVGRVTVLLPE
jgi:filamentous hemagglutinin family protein